MPCGHVQLGSGQPSEETLMQPAPDPSALPWLAIKFGMALGRFVELLPNYVQPSGIQMLQLTAIAHFKSSTIKALAELGGSPPPPPPPPPPPGLPGCREIVCNPPAIQMLQLTAVAHWKSSTIKALAELGDSALNPPPPPPPF